MQFGTLTWTLDVFSFISAWHFSIVAASHCSLQLRFLISFGRGQGSAAGAAEDHITCIRCFEVHGTNGSSWEGFSSLVVRYVVFSYVFLQERFCACSLVP